MYRIVRVLPCLTLLAATIFGAVPQSITATPQQTLVKKLIDGEWRASAIAVSASTPAYVTGSSDSFPVTQLGGWGRMVFSSFRDGNSDIYAFKPIPNTIMTTNLTRHNANDSQPRLNPTADRIAFVSNRDGNYEIYGMNFDGQGLLRLTQTPGDDRQPFWSPDGSRIVFSSNRDGNYNLYVMDANGAHPTRLTNGGSDLMPSWSPDGRTLAWVRAGTTTGTIWLMNADGSNQRAITSPLQYLQHPSWSPDGTRLAFDYDRNGDGFNDLATIAIDGTDLQAVTFPTNTYGTTQMVDLAMSTWAPPGDWLAVGVATYNLGDMSLYGAYVGQVYLKGTRAHALLFPEYDFQPDIRSLDLTSPTTIMQALPRYSRGTTASLAWSGTDTGLAGNVVYDVQVRNGAAGAWTPVRTGTQETTTDYTGASGSTVSFRIRGRDAAGNAEPWHAPFGNDTTTFFAAKITGKVTDNRGKPIPYTPVNMTPASITGNTTDRAGNFLAYLTSTGNHTLSSGHSGYQSPPATALDMQRDRSFNAYLLPLDNQIQNSGFETSANPLASWTHSGTFPANASLGNGLTGGSAALLGQPCAFPCLGNREPAPIGTGASADMAVDSNGKAHVVYSLHYAGTLYYTVRGVDGAWTTPQSLTFSGGKPRLVFDAAGTLHTTWIAPNGYVKYSQRTLSGDWSVPVDLGPALNHQIVIDQQGQVYVSAVCWSHNDCVGPSGSYAMGYYRKRTTAGVWLPPVQLATTRFALAVGRDNRAFVAWQAADSNSYVAGVNPDGSIGTPRRFATNESIYTPHILVDLEGVVHIFWTYGSQIWYTTMVGDGEIAPASMVVQGDTVSDLALDAYGTIHLLTYSDWSSGGTYYRVKPAGAPWSAPALVNESSRVLGALEIDTSARLHMLHYGDLYNVVTYQATPRVESAGEASIRQSVVVPVTKPTLAFGYNLSGTSAADSKLDVIITQAGVSETVFSATTSTGWSLASVDLGRWAGQTIDVALTLHQASNALPASALIDDVSVGSWQTPVIAGMTPPTVATPGQATQLTITGENFVATPTVRIGATVLNDVQWIDEQTLHATVPAGMKLGRHDLWITNPGGQVAVQQLVIGKEVLLPLMFR